MTVDHRSRRAAMGVRFRPGIVATLAVAAAVAALAAASPAGARSDDSVVPFRSIGRARLGESPAQIRREVGRPSAVYTDDHGTPQEFDYHRLHLNVVFDLGVRNHPAYLIYVSGAPITRSPAFGSAHPRSLPGVTCSDSGDSSASAWPARSTRRGRTA